MKLLDRIVLNNFLRIIRDLIIRIADYFEKQNKPVKPQPKPTPHRPRPLKKIIDLIPVPWRTKDE
jgi:hypothetical protein